MRGEDIVITALKLDGALVLDVAAGGSLRIEALEVTNQGWELVELTDAEQASDRYVSLFYIDGFVVVTWWLRGGYVAVTWRLQGRRPRRS